MNTPIQSNTLTPRQQQRVLETIAGRMNTLNRVLMAMQANALDVFDEGTVVDAAQFMAATIGAMADDAVGGGVCGDARHWMYGPLFADGAAQEGDAA